MRRRSLAKALVTVGQRPADPLGDGDELDLGIRDCDGLLHVARVEGGEHPFEQLVRITH
jgi:hypothetical protein